MNQSCHDSAYRTAMNAAMAELDLISEEAISVRNRIDQLEVVLEALKPFLTAAEDRRTIESTAKTVPTQHMVRIAVPHLVPQKVIEATDPIQRRINYVFGLATA